MAGISQFFNQVFQGATNPKGNLGDWQHGRALYTNDNFRLAPKHKFLYHCTFTLNRDAVKVIPQLKTQEINMLVKAVDLPKYNIGMSLKHQYNKKRNLQTRLDYEPINITFHDDNYGQTTALWEAYYRYYFRDGTYAAFDVPGFPNQKHAAYNRGNTYTGEINNVHRFGLDNDSFYNFFDSIQIYQMSRRRYTSFTLVNPMIQSWQHDTMENSSSDPVQSTMQILYETVWYGRGGIDTKIGSAPKSFGVASGHYDTVPSPLTNIGGGTSSLLGQGGVVEGALDVLGDITSGKINTPAGLLGTVLKGANVFKNAKSLTKGGLRQEGFNILKGAIGSIGGISQGNVGGVANTFFPKSGGTGGTVGSLIPTVSGVIGLTKVVKGFSGTSGGDIALALGTNPLVKAALAKQGPFLKDQLNQGLAVASGEGGLVNAVARSWDALPRNEQAEWETIAVANVKTTVQNNPNINITGAPPGTPTSVFT